MTRTRCPLSAPLLWCVLLFLPGVAAAGEPPPWALMEDAPGPDLPPRGRSLFDALVTVTDAAGGAVKTEIPFPFERLLDRIREHLDSEESGVGGLVPVLIPIGRSLQRNAAAPDYFHSPRIVVAVTGEPRSTRAPLFKDRLYIGYHEQAAVLEIISYNDVLGRFEFQVVKNYRAGVTPDLYYMKRSICMACHQNQAPIFSRPLWSETNANPDIAARLAAARESFYGITAQRDIDAPAAIDAATDRANLFAFYQRLWSEGCAADTADACRSSLLNAVLQFRLSGRQGYADDGALPLRNILSQWRQRWSQGMRLPNPDLPNRDPFLVTTAAAHEVVVDAQTDPLLTRTPLAVRTFDNETDLLSLIDGLSGFFAEADIRALDALLFARPVTTDVQRQRLGCQYNAVRSDRERVRLDLRCAAKDSKRAFELEGRIYTENGQFDRGLIDRLRVQREVYRNIELRPSATAAATKLPAEFALWRDDLHLRLSDGSSIEAIAFEDLPSGTAAGASSGAAAIDVRSDYAPLKHALVAIAQQSGVAVDTAHARAPLYRANIMPSLLRALGATNADACCDDTTAWPPPRMEPFTATAADDASLEPGYRAALSTLQRYCSACHDSAEHFPPNFLQGSPAQIREKLVHCAPRIGYRLRMWNVAADARGKTPMPPETTLLALGKEPSRWITEPEMVDLQEFVRGLQRAAPVRTGIENSAYAALETCLP